LSQQDIYHQNEDDKTINENRWNSDINRNSSDQQINLKQRTLQTSSQPIPSSSPPRTTLKSLQHVAIICDGNSRWAKSSTTTTGTSTEESQQGRILNNIPLDEYPTDHFSLDDTPSTSTTPTPIHGHAMGASRVVSLLKYIHENYSDTIHFVTLYGFSSENWSRPSHEIRDIWKVMEQTAENVKEWVRHEYLCIKIIGDLNDDRIPFSLRKTLLALEKGHVSMKKKQQRKQDQNQPTLTLCIAINYGGRSDILNATRKIAELVEKGAMKAKDVNMDVVGSLLSTNGIPDPDLVIRTGGEQRLSNFLIWNIAYAELYFTNVLWPDFDENEFEFALDWYHGRERRFGGRK
jgi:undecaprenyl diphosphate synthase